MLNEIGKTDIVERILQSPGFQHYEALGQPNWGGMGVVQRAWDRVSSTEVGIKILLADVNQERFQREIEALMALDHPNIVEILESGTVNHCPFFIMTWHSGKSLDRFLDDAHGGEKLDEFWFRRFFQSLAETLNYCHEKGVIHRDLKPQNILVDARGEPILIDFGLVKANKESEEEWVVGQPTLTKSGEIVGTPAYMSPEQLDTSGQWGPVSEASDVWGFGATLYFALTGCSPFQTESLTELYYKALNTTPVPISELNPEVSKSLANVARLCLVRDQKDRLTLPTIVKQLDLNGYSEPRFSATAVLVALSVFIVLSLIFFLIPPLSEDPVVISSLGPVPKLTNEKAVKVTGHLSEPFATIIIDGQTVQAGGTGYFEAVVDLHEGTNRICFSIPESDEMDAFQAVELICDRQSPEFAVLLPQSPEGVYLCSSDYLFKGQLIDKYPMSVSFNEKSIATNERGDFLIQLSQSETVQSFTLRGLDKAGNQVELPVKVQESESYQRALEEKRARKRRIDIERKAKESRSANKAPTIDEYPLVRDFSDSINRQRADYRSLFHDARDAATMAPLLDIDDWENCSRSKQEASISWVGKRIKNRFEFIGGRNYQCGTTRCYIGRFRHKRSGLILHLLPGGKRVKRWFERPDRAYNLQVLSLLGSENFSQSVLRYALITNAAGGGFRENLIEAAQLHEKIPGFDELLKQYKKNPWGRFKGYGAKRDVFDAIVDFFYKDPAQLQWLKQFLENLHKSVISREKFFFTGEYTPPFLIGQNEVTQAIFTQFGEGAKILEKLELRTGRGPQYPIYKISHSQAIQWLKANDELLRLPTELEWSHAYKGGAQSEFFWGNEKDKSKNHVWSFGQSAGMTVHAVTEHSTNGNSFGLIDMAGNVGEWCANSWDIYSKRAKELKLQITGQPTAVNTVETYFKEPFMGGSIFHHWRFCHPKFSQYDSQDSSWRPRGFRVAYSIPLKAK